jgi:hypothetical protein
MSEEHAPKQEDAGQDDAGQDNAGQDDAGQEDAGDDRNGAGDSGVGTGTDPAAATVGSKLDPDFVPDESHENPNEERARKHPEETGS